jgi:SAM-dependent methyltransferase
MANETAKATRRRWIEDFKGEFPWLKIFTGNGLDVGCGPDKLPLGDCKPFDKEHGDAEKLDEIIALNSLDYLHASQCLEHMSNPADALARWLRCVRKDGHLIFSVPDFDAYEKRHWPSKFNGDHRAAFSMWRKGFPNVPLFYHVPSMLKDYNVKLCRLVLTHYNWNLSDEIDQTLEETQGTECFIEAVIQK